jgi:hypothetical protein
MEHYDPDVFGEYLKSKHPLKWTPSDRIAFLENRVNDLLANNNEQVEKRRAAEARLGAERREDFFLGMAFGLLTVVSAIFIVGMWQ